jgi:hypothetical protein
VTTNLPRCNGLVCYPTREQAYAIARNVATKRGRGRRHVVNPCGTCGAFHVQAAKPKDMWSGRAV